DREGVAYIFVDKKWVGNPKRWASYISREAVEAIEGSHYFKRVFGTSRTSLFQLVGPRKQADEGENERGDL
ncbi:unnamed protein product, partial [marine sediment metagenome]